MTEPLNVDPNRLINIGGRWYGYLPDLNGTPPASGGGTWPSHVGVQAVTGAAGESTTALQQGLADTAGSAQRAGDSYQTQEGKSGDQLKMKDVTGVLSDLQGLGTGAFSVIPQVIGATTGLVGSGAGVIGSLSGAAVSAQKLGQPPSENEQPKSGGGTWNPNNNNPESSQDYTHPEPGTHTVAAPAVEPPKRVRAI